MRLFFCAALTSHLLLHNHGAAAAHIVGEPSALIVLIGAWCRVAYTEYITVALDYGAEYTFLLCSEVFNRFIGSSFCTTLNEVNHRCLLIG
jgi:hypothetical protein